MRHCGRHQGVDEGSFTASYLNKKKETKIFQLRETRINNRITIGLLTEWPFWLLEVKTTKEDERPMLRSLEKGG